VYGAVIVMPIVFDAEVAHAEETKTKEQQMSSVNEITTVNHATYFTAQCRLLVCLSILRRYFLADYQQT